MLDPFLNYNEYHLKIVDSVKTVLYKKDQTIFDKLDFYNDEIFGEPLLFSAINNDYEKWIDTLVFGLSKNKEQFCITTSVINNDLIYLPHVGHLKLSEKGLKEVTIQYVENQYKVSNNENDVNFELTASTKLEGIEVFTCNHPLIQSFFRNEQGENIAVRIDSTLFEKHKEHLTRALEVMKEVLPTYYDIIKQYITKIVLYEGDANSFATMQAHGCIFIGVRDTYDEIFFIEDIIHQTAHVFFNTSTFNKEGLFSIPFATNFFEITNDPTDKRATIYDRFHGLYTHLFINKIITGCLDNKLFNGRKYYELVARFTLNNQRFATGLRKMKEGSLFQEKGQEWMLLFVDNFKTTYNRYKELLEKYDVSNQPYVFDFRKFEEINRRIIEEERKSTIHN